MDDYFEQSKIEWLSRGKIGIPSLQKTSQGSTSATFEQTILFESLTKALNKFTVDLDQIKRSIVPSLSVSISDLDASKYFLVKPINIILNKESDRWYAEPVDYDIFSEGNDEKDALNNLKKIIIEYYKMLSSEKELSIKLKDKLILLKTFLHER